MTVRVVGIKVSFTLLATFCILVISGSPMQASQYLGEVTWTFTQTIQVPPGSTPPPVEVKAGLSRVSSSYYLLQGQIASAPGGGPAILSGGGALVGNNLLLSVTMTQVDSDGYHGTMVMQISIDKSTFNGIFWFINNNCNPSSGNFNQSYTGGTVTISGTPFPLGSIPTAALPLLLD